MCYNGGESGMKGYAIAPIDELRVKYPADSCRYWESSNCCATGTDTDMDSIINRMLATLTEQEKAQLLSMIMQAGIPKKTTWNDKEGLPNV